MDQGLVPRTAFVALAIVLVATGCSGQSAVPPARTASSASAAAPSGIPHSPGPVASAQPDGKARSDAFWRALAMQAASEYYEDVAQMTRASDLVVIGRFASLEEGRSAGEPVPGQEDPGVGVLHFAIARVAVDQVLHGQPRSERRGEVTVELSLPDPSKLPDLQASLPGEPTMFFLVNQGDNGKRRGRPQSYQESVKYIYREVSTQPPLRNIGGKVSVPAGGEGEFPASLEGAAFDGVADQVRRITP